MRPVAPSIAIVLLALLPSCGGREESPSAAACASVVQRVRDLSNRVEVAGAEETAEGQVEIHYEYVGDMNLPVTGTATCTFAVGGPGSLTLIEGILDGEPLGPAEISAANRALAE